MCSKENKKWRKRGPKSTWYSHTERNTLCVSSSSLSQPSPPRKHCRDAIPTATLHLGTTHCFPRQETSGRAQLFMLKNSTQHHSSLFPVMITARTRGRLSSREAELQGTDPHAAAGGDQPQLSSFQLWMPAQFLLPQEGI